jgi:hypothetical protein
LIRAKGGGFPRINISRLATDHRATTLIGEEDAVRTATVEACNHDTARRYIDNARAAKTHAASLFLRKPRRATVTRAVRTAPTRTRTIGTTPARAAASVMTVSILNLNSELNIRASRGSWSGDGNSAEGDEGSQAGFCEGAEHELTPFVSAPAGTSPGD